MNGLRGVSVASRAELGLVSGPDIVFRGRIVLETFLTRKVASK